MPKIYGIVNTPKAVDRWIFITFITEVNNESFNSSLNTSFRINTLEVVHLLEAEMNRYIRSFMQLKKPLHCRNVHCGRPLYNTFDRQLRYHWLLCLQEQTHNCYFSPIFGFRQNPQINMTSR